MIAIVPKIIQDCLTNDQFSHIIFFYYKYSILHIFYCKIEILLTF